MAKPRDRVYTATRVIDVAMMMQHPEQIIQATLLTALQQVMDEVRLRMEADEANPNPTAMPELVITYQVKGGTHHGPQGE